MVRGARSYFEGRAGGLVALVHVFAGQEYEKTARTRCLNAPLYHSAHIRTHLVIRHMHLHHRAGSNISVSGECLFFSPLRFHFVLYLGGLVAVRGWQWCNAPEGRLLLNIEHAAAVNEVQQVCERSWGSRAALWLVRPARPARPARVPCYRAASSAGNNPVTRAGRCGAVAKWISESGSGLGRRPACLSSMQHFLL